MTNKEIMYQAFIDANNAQHSAIQLRDKLEALYGEDFPLTQMLNEITEGLDAVSNIHYNLGGGGEVGCDTFIDWLSDGREWGPCRDCANRKETDGRGFHRCKLSGGQMSPEYACQEWKAKEEVSNEQD